MMQSKTFVSSLAFVVLAATLNVTGCGAAGGGSINKKHSMASSDAPVGLYLGQALTGDSVKKTKAKPALIPVALNKRCSFRKASRDARIVYIKGFSQRQNDGMFHHRFKDDSANRFGVVDSHAPLDIVVTDTGQPIFLVIGSVSKHMWTLHTAPGVKIDGVALNTEFGSSIANLSEGAKVSFVAKNGSPQEGCFKTLVEPKTADQLVAINRGVGYTPSKEDLRNYKRFEREGRQWLEMKFPGKFGGSASETIFADAKTGFYSVLIGPVPDEPLKAAPITTVHYPDHLDVMWAKRSEAIKDWVAEERGLIRDIQKDGYKGLGN